MIQALRKNCQSHTGQPCKSYGIFLTRFQDNAVIVRCHHTAKELTISLLQSISSLNNTHVHIETIGTSGTIKSLLSKHFSDDVLRR